MCGRYTVTVDPATLYGAFDAEPDEPEKADERDADSRGRGAASGGLYGGEPPRPRYNIAPTDMVPVVRVRPGHDGEPDRRLLTLARWGLVPFWAKDPSAGSRMFNARADSLTVKPAFRKAFATRRALLPASGYYEWRKPAAGAPAKIGKQPFYITPADGSVMAFAGLWEFWRSPDGRPLVSASIITTDAVGDLAAIHDRMPLILPASDWADWLDPAADAADVSPLLAAPSVELLAGLELRPVGTRVGNVRNDDAGLIEKVAISQ